MTLSRLVINSATLLVLLCVVSSVLSLSCYKCSTLDDGENACDDIQPSVCDSDLDVCIKVVTKLQQPNNGPEDRLKDNEVKTYVSKSCGRKDTFDHYVAVEKCTDDTVGGGGVQVRCMCVGNKCNSAGYATFSLLTTVSTLVVALIL